MTKKFAAALILLTIILSSGAGAAGENPKVGVLDFYVKARIPFDALDGAVEPVGDDIFSAQRKGLTRTLRRLVYGLLEENTDIRLARLREPEFFFGKDAEDVFRYYSPTNDPASLFDTSYLDKFAEEINADRLLLGVVLELGASSVDPSANNIAMKVAFMEYDPENGEFTFSKTYQGNSGLVNGYADQEALPKMHGQVPDDIAMFAMSESGRVFLSIAEQFITEYSGKVPDQKLLQGGNNLAGGPGALAGGNGVKGGGTGRPERVAGTEGGRTSGGPPPPEEFTYKPAADCIDRGQAILAAPIGSTPGLKAFECRNGRVDLSRYSYLSGAMGPTAGRQAGLSSISTGDLNGDGIDEVITGSFRPGEYIGVHGTLGGRVNLDNPLQVINNVFGQINSGVYVATGDFDGDGDSEVAVTATTGEYAMVLDYRNGWVRGADPVITINPVFGETRNGLNVAAGDFDGDGRDDLVLASDGGGEMVKIYSLPYGVRPRPSIIAEITDFMDGYTPSVSVAAGDFDGDGRDDLALGSMAGGARVKVLSMKDGSFDMEKPLADFRFDYNDPSIGVRVYAGDFNGDRQDDLAVASVDSAGELWIFQYRHGVFDLDSPYLEPKSVFPAFPRGVIVAAGTFRKQN